MFKPGDACIIKNDPIKENNGKEIVLSVKPPIVYEGKQHLAFDSKVEIAVSDFGMPDDVIAGYDYDGYITEDCIELVEMFYIQDSRTYVGNNIIWWSKFGGYTTDINEAEIFTRKEAFAQNESRDSDIPWSVKYINTKIRHVVDMQDVRKRDDVAGLIVDKPKPETKKVPPDTYRCNGCGRFMSRTAYYTVPCPRCDTENWD